MNERIRGKFEKGERGPICKRPSDRGAWIVHDEWIDPDLGVEYVLEVTRTYRRIRYARIVETVAAEYARLREKYEPVVKETLANAANLEGYYNLGNSGVKFEVAGEKFHFERTGRSGEGYAKNWLNGPDWLPMFRITDAVLEAIEKAKVAYEAKQEQERQEQRAREAQWQAERDAKRAAEVAKDAPLVAAFFADHPEATAWFGSSATSLTWSELSEQAIGHGLARVIHRGGEYTIYASFSKEIRGYDATYELIVGGKTITMLRVVITEDSED